MGNCLTCSSNSKTLFRDHRYHKNVWIGKRTVKQGECCALWDMNGKYKLIHGPKRKWILCSDVRFLQRFHADQHQYLKVQYTNGAIEHINGPKLMFLDPVQHVSIQVKNAFVLDSFEAMVVYTERAVGTPHDDSTLHSFYGYTLGPDANISTKSKGVGGHHAGTSPTSEVQRTVIYGPQVFYPTANEHVELFNFSNGSSSGVGASQGAASDSKQGATKRLVSTDEHTSAKLCLLDQQMLTTIKAVSSDDIPIKITMTLNYKIVGVDKMIDNTKDPTVDVEQALQAEIIRHASQYPYVDLIKTLSRPPNLQDFPLLHERAHKVGLIITQVGYQGYKGTENIQKALESQLEVKLQTEAKQAAATNELELAKLKAEQDEALLDRKTKLADTSQKAELTREQLRHEQEVSHLREHNGVKLEFLKGLSDLGVDVARYMAYQEAFQQQIIIDSQVRQQQQADEEHAPTPVNTQQRYKRQSGTANPEARSNKVLQNL